MGREIVGQPTVYRDPVAMQLVELDARQSFRKVCAPNHLGVVAGVQLAARIDYRVIGAKGQHGRRMVDEVSLILQDRLPRRGTGLGLQCVLENADFRPASYRQSIVGVADDAITLV